MYITKLEYAKYTIFYIITLGEFHISEVQPRHPPSQISFKFGTIVGPNGVKKIAKFQHASIYCSQVTSIQNLAQNGLFKTVMLRQLIT